jgi:Mce-associated membrane protein
MAETTGPPGDSGAPNPEVKALLDEAEAQAAAAEAVAAAAQARARAARLRREALGLPDPAEYYGDEDFAEDEDDDEAAPEEYGDYGDEYEEEYEESADEYYDGSAAEPDGWRRWMPLLGAAAAVVLIVAFAGLSAYMVAQHRDATAHQRREAAFVGGAKQGVLNMISLNSNRAKEDVQRVIDGSTGQFKDEFQQRANDFVSMVTQSKAVTDGTVHAAALESLNGDSAVVLVSATSQVTNSPPGKDVPPLMWRLRVTVTQVGGQYKLSKVEYVP